MAISPVEELVVPGQTLLMACVSGMRKQSNASWDINGASTNPYMALTHRRTHCALSLSEALNSWQASFIFRQWRQQFSGRSTNTVLGSFAS